MTTIQFPSEFKDIIIEYNNKNFENSLKLLDNLPDIDKFKLSKIRLYASIYFVTKKWDLSLNYHNKLLTIEKGTFEIYHNLAVTLFNLGKIKDSIKYFINCIEINNKVDLPYQNLGISYMHIGDYKNATKCFVNAINLNNKNINCITMLIDILNYTVPEKDESNYLLKLNKKVLNFNNKEEGITNSKYSEIVKLVNEIQEDLKNQTNEIIYNKTEIFRRNSEDLNCKRHFKVFNKFEVIPEYCFNCYKVQINIKDIYNLIKLFLLFNTDYLINNNIRKCMVETRNNIQENFKGFIYCRNLDEAKKILKDTKINLSRHRINYKKIEIKHGCTEYYEKYPKFKNINLNGKQEMIYNKSWKIHENEVDNKLSSFKKRVINPSTNIINLSDILIIKNWLIYAEIIGDNSCKDIFENKKPSNYLNEMLKDQIEFRKSQLNTK